MPLNVLGIMPDVPGLPKLALWEEFTDLNNIEGADISVVGGLTANSRCIGAALRKPHDLIIWSGHGEPGVLVVPSLDGKKAERILPQWLATQVAAASPLVAILAACHSAGTNGDLESLAKSISRKGVNAVAMDIAVSDRSAICFNWAFVEALVAKRDVANAFDVAQAQLAQTDPVTAQNIMLFNASTNGFREYHDALRGFGQRLDNIEQGVGRRLDIVEGKVDTLLRRGT